MGTPEFYTSPAPTRSKGKRNEPYMVANVIWMGRRYPVCSVVRIDPRGEGVQMTLEVLAAIGNLAAGDDALRAHLIKCYASKAWVSVTKSPGGMEMSRIGPNTYQSAEILLECLKEFQREASVYQAIVAPAGTIIGGGNLVVEKK